MVQNHAKLLNKKNDYLMGGGQFLSATFFECNCLFLSGVLFYGVILRVFFFKSLLISVKNKLREIFFLNMKNFFLFGVQNKLLYSFFFCFFAFR